MRASMRPLPPLTAVRSSDGRSRACALRWLDAAAVPEIVRLQQHVASLLAAADYYPQSEDELRAMFAGGGLAVGAAADGGLIAFHTAVVPGASSPDNLGIDVGLPTEALGQVAHLENCVVHPDFRGNGLQRLLAVHLIEALAADGIRYLCETVAPGNWPSIKSTLDNGLIMTALKKKYGEHWRYLFVRDTTRPARPDTAAIHWVDASDSQGQQEQFAAGRAAVQLVQEQGRTRLGFADLLPS